MARRKRQKEPVVAPNAGNPGVPRGPYKGKNYRDKRLSVKIEENDLEIIKRAAANLKMAMSDYVINLMLKESYKIIEHYEGPGVLADLKAGRGEGPQDDDFRDQYLRSE